MMIQMCHRGTGEHGQCEHNESGKDHLRHHHCSSVSASAGTVTPTKRKPSTLCRVFLSWNDDINVELDEHVCHREARDNEAGAAGRDALQVARDSIVNRFAVRAVQ